MEKMKNEFCYKDIIVCRYQMICKYNQKWFKCDKDKDENNLRHLCSAKWLRNEFISNTVFIFKKNDKRNTVYEWDTSKNVKSRKYASSQNCVKLAKKKGFAKARRSWNHNCIGTIKEILYINEILVRTWRVENTLHHKTV